MRFKNYLLMERVKMPVKQLRRFKDIIEGFFVEYPNYKYTTTERFISDLENHNHKAMSVLFGNLEIESIPQFINKYQEVINKMHESIHAD